MSEAETRAAAEPPRPPWFQFKLGTLILVFVVLASSLAVFGAWGILMFGLAVWSAVHLHNWPSSRSSAPSSFAALCIVALIASGISHELTEITRHSRCRYNVEQIAHALQQYRNANGRFPPAYIADKSGKPVHSWRVLLLPYLDYGNSFNIYSLAEPWNGPNNSRVCTSRPIGYVCSSDRQNFLKPTSETNYVAVVGKSGAWSGDKARTLNDLGDKAANTIMVIETVNSGIAWSEPKDLSLDELAEKNGESGLTPSSSHGPKSNFFVTYEEANGVYAAMADGSVRYLTTHA